MGKQIILGFIAILVPLLLSGQEYKVDKEASTIRWEGANLVRSHYGFINISEGILEFKAGVPTAARIVIDMNSLSNSDLKEEERRDRLESHLKSDDFFGVEKHPYSSFTLKRVENNKGGSFHIIGDMMIKGISNPVDFVTSITKDNGELIFTGHIEVDRSLFDVRYRSGKFYDNLGDRAINDIFKLEFELHLVE